MDLLVQSDPSDLSVQSDLLGQLLLDLVVLLDLLVLLDPSDPSDL
jgi:hypothetical protein